MKIEFWLDYGCPVSYQTHKNLLEAIFELNLKDVQIYYRSYMLECSFGDDKDTFIKDIFEKNEDHPFFNTEPIHELAHLAKSENLAVEYNDKIFKSYYEENKNLNDINILLDIACECGLNYDEAKNAIESKYYLKKINNNKENALNKGITTIPHLRFDVKDNYNKYLTKEEIKKILSQKIKIEKIKEYCDYQCSLEQAEK